jgi:hypothetical protein
MKRDINVTIRHIQGAFTNLLVSHYETSTVADLQTELFRRLAVHDLTHRLLVPALLDLDSWQCSVDTAKQLKDLTQGRSLKFDRKSHPKTPITPPPPSLRASKGPQIFIKTLTGRLIVMATLSRFNLM